jgi:hypothetical protein
MLKAKVYSGRINSWDVLVSSLLAKLEEWPFLVPLYNELLSLVGESRAIVLQQESARALFHEAIGRRHDLEARGVELRTRIAAHLKAQLGFHNEQLRMFGLNPTPRTRRTTEEEPVPEITALSEAEIKTKAD